ncbi:ATP-dependent helicase [Candidatus Similichlamydia epinepheli]|uniref:ATP-dependent helicase n=1 Tax=Candidatus Similichlamydia epinepheli TaxID=1903953 RepID=UPI000D37D578|nr:ATP-dependent helicase [Candidatus Similichlamydia epinepheli]
MISELNNEQAQAVSALDRKLLVLAGAGSGKTRVLMARIASLISSGVDPSRILAVTFTSKTADQMRQRLNVMIGSSQRQSGVFISTYHSYCLSVLRQDIHHLGYTNDFSVSTEYNTFQLLRRLSIELGEDEGLTQEASSSFAYEVIQARELGHIDVEKWQLVGVSEQAQTLFSRMHISMRVYNVTDFNGLIELTLLLWRDHANCLQREQRRFDHILIDEFQDTNYLQNKLVLSLGDRDAHICIVGDDDQAIYEWRGASVKNILNFPADRIIKLEQNYRSKEPILKAANSVIACNDQRHGKQLHSMQGPGQPLEVFHAPSGEEEADSVVRRIVAMREAWSLHWRDFAILFRSNALAKSFENSLSRAVWETYDTVLGTQCRRGIPFQVFGGDQSYEATEEYDLCAYLSLFLNRKDQCSLLRVINKPSRGISEDTLDSFTSIQRKEGLDDLNDLFREGHSSGVWESLSEDEKSSILSFTHLIDEGSEKIIHEPLNTVLNWLVNKINYIKYVKESIKSEAACLRKEELIKNFIQTSVKFSARHEQEGKSRIQTCLDFITKIVLDDSNKHLTRSRGDVVTLSTFHASKGLEFPVCFLVGLEDKIVPHVKGVNEGRLEEERRLFYVALTRAMNYVCLSMANSRKRGSTKMACEPSPFLYEISKELMRPTYWDAPLHYSGVL